MKRALLGVVALAVLAAACGRTSGGPRAPEASTLHAVGVGAAVDPTVRPARLLPEHVDESHTYGVEAGGGVRAITAGLRVVTAKEGAILAADERLPQAPQTTVALPERLGGGFLFVLGTTIWRADRWLGPARPIFTSSAAVQTILPGLDRVYLRAQNAWLAIDGREGRVLDLGPFPASPWVSSFAAADGWRAAAITDLRGAVATFDAGATWRSLDLPVEPLDVVVSGDSLAIGGVEGGRSEAWFDVRVDGSIARLAAPPRDAKALVAAPGSAPGGYTGASGQPRTSATSKADAPPDDVRDEAQDPGTRIFGKRPLAAAIEDGWPLTDGTAVVARDGALGRVRLSDGALIELVQQAYPLRPSRCHPVSLTRPNAQGAFGFVCGEPRGATILYAYEPLKGRLAEIKRFDRPRVVTASGNGALAVRGPCAEDADPSPKDAVPRLAPAPPDKADDKDRDDHEDTDDEKGDDKSKAPGRADPGAHVLAPEPAALETKKKKKGDARPALVVRPAPPEVHPYCVLGHDNTWREVHVRGDVGGERVVVLADGKIAVVSPPQSPTAPARLTILERGKATTVAVVFPKVTADVARVLRLGLWLDGFEERRPGVLGGWIEAGGTMLGLEIALDGKATPGQFVRDAGLPFVSGRYGFGWTASRRGYETTDGGMTWKSLELPDTLVPVSKVERRACGPVGCLAAGWLRVGWGDAKKPAVPPAPPAYHATINVSPPQLAVTCEPLASTPPPAPPPKPRREAPAATPSLGTRRSSFGSPPVLAPTGGVVGSPDLLPFFSHPATVLHEPERGIGIDVQDLLDRYPRVGPLARVYAWGPKGGDWETQGKWQVKWLSPFAGWPDVHASAPVLPPQGIADLTKATPYGGPFGYPYSYNNNFALAPGDDPSHALLVLRRPFGHTGLTLFELDADRAPVEIRRADGEPFGEIDAFVRAAGRWFAVTPPNHGTTARTSTVWTIEGGVARELVRVPRAVTDHSAKARLARRSDGRAIGLVVEGQPTAQRSTATRWVLPIDLESGQTGEPELVGYTDLAGRTLEACTEDTVGWSVDAPLPGTTARLRLPQGSGSMHSLFARVRLTATHACVERLTGMYDGQSADRAAQLARPGASKGAGAARPGEILLTAFSAQARYPLRCTLTK